MITNLLNDFNANKHLQTMLHFNILVDLSDETLK